MYAKILDNIVIELIDDSYYLGLSIEDQELYSIIDDSASLGWTYNDNNVPLPPTTAIPGVSLPEDVLYKYALIENSVVKEVYETNPMNLFSKDYASRFIRCPIEVNTGWLYDGELFTAPPTPPAVIPQTVTMRQARLALHNAGYLATVNAAISSAGAEAMIEWEYSSIVDRNKALVAQMQVVLGLTDTEIDELFVTASQLN